MVATAFRRRNGLRGSPSSPYFKCQWTEPHEMIACLDVQYQDTTACAAGIVFRDWLDAKALEEKVIQLADIQPYESGQFFRRELPCLMAILQRLPKIGIVIVDGYVWLEGEGKPALGACLYDALAGQATVIGVAKTKFRGAHGVCEITRGRSRRPLFISAAGMHPEEAAKHVRSMDGDYRIPTLLARADYLCRHEKAD
jgi:deoxyribonuclease V